MHIMLLRLSDSSLWRGTQLDVSLAPQTITVETGEGPLA
jgi:hypothetical protein